MEWWNAPIADVGPELTADNVVAVATALPLADAARTELSERQRADRTAQRELEFSLVGALLTVALGVAAHVAIFDEYNANRRGTADYSPWIDLLWLAWIFGGIPMLGATLLACAKIVFENSFRKARYGRSVAGSHRLIDRTDV